MYLFPQSTSKYSIIFHSCYPLSIPSLRKIQEHELSTQVSLIAKKKKKFQEKMGTTSVSLKIILKRVQEPQEKK